MSIVKKPEVFRKFRDFHKYLRENDGKIGTKQRGIDVNLNNACNLRCEHCFTNSPLGDHVKPILSPETISRLADEAHKQGIFEWDLQGGELLLRKKDLYKTLEAIGTERFYMYVTTNGYYLDEKCASKLAALGVDRVSVSIDSIDPEVHDSFRKKKGSWERAIRALEHVKDAGMIPYLNITVGRYNAQSQDIRALFELSKNNKYTTLINVATPAGMWQNLDEVMISDEDRAHLISLRKEYKNALRNLWDPFDRNNEGVIGCNTVNRLYVTPLGDVLACPYVHIKIGNIYEESLEEITARGFSFTKFRDHSAICLAGEDREFVKNYMMRRKTSIFDPVDVKELIAEESADAESLIPVSNITEINNS